jgi:hypothetical protein
MVGATANGLAVLPASPVLPIVRGTEGHNMAIPLAITAASLVVTRVGEDGRDIIAWKSCRST